MASTESRADELGRLLVKSAQAALGEPREMTLAAVAESVGTSIDELERLFEAAGRLRETGYGQRDVDYARIVLDLLPLFGVEELIRSGRVRSRAMSQVVVSDLMTISRALRRLGETADEADVEALAQLLVAAGVEIAPKVEQLLAADYREMLLRLLDTDVVAGSPSTAAEGSLRLAVGFADLVGYTRLSASIDPDGLASVLRAFEELVHDATDDLGGILVPKFIGDAAMLVAEDANVMGAALLQIVESAPPELEGVPRRAGFSFGPVLVREGDYFGTAVNTAARLTDLARPESVLLSPDTAEHLDDSWQLRRTRPMRVKGLDTIQPWRLRRAEPSNDEDVADADGLLSTVEDVVDG
ncbi:MAG: adenylate/guanylate cyclase domain-containing protein [Nitriliruptorales bacterium]|nr:adenylate/guanylate cyclase domain-containing protein [Nitriliruptorales bacterium]